MFPIDPSNLRVRDVMLLVSVPIGFIILILLPGWIKILDAYYYLGIMGLIISVLGIVYIKNKKIEAGRSYGGSHGSAGGAPLFLLIPLIVVLILKIFVSVKKIEGVSAQIIGVIFLISGLAMIGVGISHFL